MTAKSLSDQVREFHTAFGVPAPDEPTPLEFRRQLLRVSLIREELREYAMALAQDDLVAIADALADLAYVVIGAAVEHGLARFDEIFAEVHRSNMSKLGADGQPVLREDGKVLKGPAYSPPNLEPLLRPDPEDKRGLFGGGA